MTCAFACAGAILTAADGDWAYWRGPNADGMARRRRAAPVERHGGHQVESDGPRQRALVAGRVGRSDLPDHGRADRRAAPTRGAAWSNTASSSCATTARREPVWERVARVETPHEPHHSTYGSFASNAPVTDGTHVYAFFGSRGLYAYTLDGRLAWQKDFGRLTMFMTFGEGAWTWLEDDTLLVVLDHEGDSSWWRSTRATGASAGARRGRATRTGRDLMSPSRTAASR